MGVGNIIQKNIANGCEAVWKKVPELPQLSINLTRYNRPFVNFVALVGAYALYKSSVYLTRRTIQLAKGMPKLPTKQQMQEKYGQNSWALIVDCKGNQQYCILLAKNGFNLILCGEEDDIRIAKDQVVRKSGASQIRIQTVVINWEQQAKNPRIYEQLLEQLKDFDISFMIMPTIRKDVRSPTVSEKIPVFEHIYLMARHFGPKLKWRSYTSAIIVPSTEQVDKVDSNLNGITRAVQSGIDAFGRTLGFELRGLIQLVIARGSIENAIASLGRSRVSH